MKLLPHTLLSTLLLGMIGAANAASSVDLAVTGSITPSACTTTFKNGGTVDYGKISAKDLNPDPTKETRLGAGTLSFVLTCDAATLVALKSQDNRAGTAWTNSSSDFGLGLVNGTEKLGGYNLSLFNFTGDGVAVRNIISYSNGATWSTNNVLWPGLLMSAADNTTVAPTPLTVLTGDIRVRPRIAPTNTLTLGTELEMDGSATLTVTYL